MQSDIVRKHLLKITEAEFADTMSQNPWRSLLWESVRKCSVRGSFRGLFDRKCSTTDGESPVINWTQYSRETYTLHLMKAIAATTKGLGDFMHSRCSSSDCPEVFSRAEAMVREKYASIVHVRMSNKIGRAHV